MTSTLPYMSDTHDARLEVRLPTSLLEQIDEARGDVPRAAWVRRALEARLTISDDDLRSLIAVYFASGHGAAAVDDTDRGNAKLALATHRKSGSSSLLRTLSALPRAGGRRIETADA